jgi:hypothetical protein
VNAEAQARRERKYVLDVARDYKNRGYPVIYEPERADLPEFLRVFSPDLLALGDHESVVVEVKTRKQLADSRTVRDLEEHVKREPGWRFELIVLPVEDEARRAAALDVTPIDQLRSQVDVALTWYPRSSAVALMLLTNVIDAALRQLAAREGVQPEESSLAHLVKQLYVDSELPRDQYETLAHAAELRDLVLRGVELDISASRQIPEIARLAKQLLRRVGSRKTKA